MMEVKGYRILVKAKEIERTSKGGIIISVEGTNEDKLEQNGNQFGIVVGIGHTCYKGGVSDEPWCEIGDEIIFARHAGRFVFDPETNEQYLIMNDDEVLCVTRKGAAKDA
jgi:co-chaperonin GroES (HSP10)